MSFFSHYSTVKSIPARLFSRSVRVSRFPLRARRLVSTMGGKKGDPIYLSFPDGVDGIKGKYQKRIREKLTEGWKYES